MLPKSQRLNLKTDFKWVANGKKLETKYLKLFIKFGENELPRIGIAISGKTFKKAVERNRARRLTSSAFETLFSGLPKGVNILVLPKAGVVAVKSGDLVTDLETALGSVGILGDKDIKRKIA